jgi:phosphopantetheinyl transferase
MAGLNEYGKPFLRGVPEEEFNLSHAGRYVACAFDDRPLGIDIERRRPVKRGVATRFFAPDEAAFLASLPPEEREEGFLDLWTKKESRVKWEGRGLSLPLPSFSVLAPGGVFYHRVFRNAEALCHVCTAREEVPAARILSLTDALTRTLRGLL